MGTVSDSAGAAIAIPGLWGSSAATAATITN
jgi:hypothetical protein